MQLDGFIGTAIHILDRIIEVGRSVRAGDDKALRDKVAETDRLIAGVQCLVVSCNLMLQQSGPPAMGPATPATPPEMPSGARVSKHLCYFATCGSSTGRLTSELLWKTPSSRHVVSCVASQSALTHDISLRSVKHASCSSPGERSSRGIRSG